jgi:hypothetical protein
MATIIDSGTINAIQPESARHLNQLPTECRHEHDCACEIPAEAPQGQEYVKWEYKARQQPKWGTVTKDGLVVGRGATKKVVPPDEVWKLAAMGCTLEEMADWFQVKPDTLKYNFAEYIAKGRAELKRRLRAAQLKVAMGGNATMLIWLGKNILGQSDNPLDSAANQPLPWSDGDL